MIFGGVLKWWRVRSWKPLGRESVARVRIPPPPPEGREINDDVPARSTVNLLALSQKMCTSCLVHNNQWPGLSSLTIYTMLDENICFHISLKKSFMFNNYDNYGWYNGNCPSYINEVIGYYKNNVMVYLDDMSVCHSRTASDISVTKWGNKRLLEQSLIR